MNFKSYLLHLASQTVNPWRIVGATLLTSLLLTLTIVVAYELAFRDRIYPGVEVAGIPVGGLTKEEAVYLMTAHTTLAVATPVTLHIAGRQYHLSNTSLELHYDNHRTIQEAYRVGRTGPMLDRAKQKRDAYLGTKNSPVYFSVNQEKMQLAVATIAAAQETPTLPARFVASGPAIAIEQEVPGHGVDEATLIAEIERRLATLSREPIGIPTVFFIPSVTTAQLSPLLPQVTQKALAPPRIEAADAVITPTPADIALWHSPPESTTSALPSSTLNEPALRAYIKNLAAQVDYPPQDALFRMEGARVAAFRPSVDGKALDQEGALLILQNYLQDANAVPSTTLTLPIVVTTATIRTDSINNLGIKELLGRGVSKFAGSIPGRMHNIRLSAQRISGVILKPGEEFSFNASVGDVSKETGYQPAYVIENGKTILGDGGGVCQTSTTLFRAVLKAGLPVLERHPHAYRVGYYEQNSTPGFDATVFSPTVDFKFKNDTPAHILVQAIYDTGTATLTTEIYGTSDGRAVSISAATITNEVKPPPIKYQDDPTLPKGVTKQVDWSAWGANVAFRRTVTRGGEVLSDTTFRSAYRPWQAVYLVGTQ